MTGPQHYAKAEEHLAAAAAIETDGHDDSMSGWHQRQALVHATLALADMTALSAVMSLEERDEWDRATGRLEDAAEVTR
jgi:hypothetical protein